MAMAAPSQGQSEAMLKVADSVGLNSDADTSPKEEKVWTPDQTPPALQKVMDSNADDLPDFAMFEATFGRAAGGRGIVTQGAPVLAEPPKRKDYGKHKDGTPRDVMESKEDCLGGFCQICR